MAIETEIKLRIASHEPVRRRLVELGAIPLGRVIEWNRILDRPDGSLRARGCGLRLRRSTPLDGGSSVTTLTFKGPVRAGEMKSREEIEIGVADFDAASELLDSIGFAPILVYEKRRESWLLDDCRIELDEPPGIGLFVEIEGPNEATIRGIQSALGLGGSPPVSASYVRLLMDYCDEQGISRQGLRLA